MYVVRFQTRNQNLKYRKLFFYLNTASSGEITAEELHNDFQTNDLQHVHRIQVEQIFDEVDFDGGGSVDYDEFVVTCISPKMLLNDSAIR